MHKSIVKLIEEKFTPEMKIKVEKLGGHYYNWEYDVIAIGLGNLVEMPKHEIEEFYGVRHDWLTDVDHKIARIIKTLELRLGIPLKKKICDAYILDMEQREFELLADLVSQCI